jgi:hypothetical protein
MPLREAGLRTAKRRFREIFPDGFCDQTYLDWERDYKWAAHRAWEATLGRAEWEGLLAEGAHAEVAKRIAMFYARAKLNMLALYEWMALREALEDRAGGKALATGLFDLIHGDGDFGPRLERFTALLDGLPQRQTRLAKWPVATLFPFVALPKRHLILKPNLMKRAAERFHFDLVSVAAERGDLRGDDELRGVAAARARLVEAARPHRHSGLHLGHDERGVRRLAVAIAAIAACRRRCRGASAPSTRRA